MINVECDKHNEDDIEVQEENVCRYPQCLFLNTPCHGPQLDGCQGACGKQTLFHHACYVAWLENKGVKDGVLTKLSIYCATK
jgi:hypothetical protein